MLFFQNKHNLEQEANQSNYFLSDDEVKEMLKYGDEHNEPFIMTEQERAEFSKTPPDQLRRIMAPESPPSDIKYKWIVSTVCISKRPFLQVTTSAIQKRIESMWYEAIAFLLLGACFLGCTLSICFF